MGTVHDDLSESKSKGQNCRFTLYTLQDTVKIGQKFAFLYQSVFSTRTIFRNIYWGFILIIGFNDCLIIVLFKRAKTRISWNKTEVNNVCTTINEGDGMRHNEAIIIIYTMDDGS